MAAGDKKVKDLDAAGTLTGSEKVLMSQSDITVTATLTIIYTYIKGLYNSASATLSNKRITKRVSSRTTDVSITPDIDTFDCFAYTAQSSGLLINAPSGTPTNFQNFSLRIKDNGVNQALTFDAVYVDGVGTGFPATTTTPKILNILFEYNSATSKWSMINLAEN